MNHQHIYPNIPEPISDPTSNSFVSRNVLHINNKNHTYYTLNDRDCQVVTKNSSVTQNVVSILGEFLWMMEGNEEEKEVDKKKKIGIERNKKKLEEKHGKGKIRVWVGEEGTYYFVTEGERVYVYKGIGRGKGGRTLAEARDRRGGYRGLPERVTTFTKGEIRRMERWGVCSPTSRCNLCPDCKAWQKSKKKHQYKAPFSPFNSFMDAPQAFFISLSLDKVLGDVLLHFRDNPDSYQSSLFESACSLLRETVRIHLRSLSSSSLSFSDAFHSCGEKTIYPNLHILLFLVGHESPSKGVLSLKSTSINENDIHKAMMDALVSFMRSLRRLMLNNRIGIRFSSACQKHYDTIGDLADTYESSPSSFPEKTIDIRLKGDANAIRDAYLYLSRYELEGLSKTYTRDGSNVVMVSNKHGNPEPINTPIFRFVQMVAGVSKNTTAFRTHKEGLVSMRIPSARHIEGTVYEILRTPRPSRKLIVERTDVVQVDVKNSLENNISQCSSEIKGYNEGVREVDNKRRHDMDIVTNRTTLLTCSPDAIAKPDNPYASLLSDFLAGRNVQTRKAYEGDLHDFARFLQSGSLASAISTLFSSDSGGAHLLVLRFKNNLLEQGFSPASINRKLASVRSLCKMGRVLGLINFNVEVSNIRAEAYRDTVGCGLDGLRKVFDFASRQRDKRKAVRDVAILRLAYDLGLRRAEIASLDTADVDFQGGRVFVLGKGRVEKVPMTLPEKTLEALRAWMAHCGTAQGDSLFINLDHAGKGCRLSAHGIYNIIKHLGKQSGVSIRPHMIRHVSITTALEQSNGNIRQAQLFARHKNPNTTVIYDDSRQDFAGQTAKAISVLL